LDAADAEFGLVDDEVIEVVLKLRSFGGFRPPQDDNATNEMTASG
jgi:hypothetical protein